jgi:hypothetical protein
VKFYVDGLLKDTQTWEGPLPNSASSLLIGCDPPGATEYFRGMMDDLRIYDYALSASDVQSVYSGAGPAPTPPPTGVPLDDFNDNTINHTLWVAHVTGSGPTIDETNQRVEITIPAASSGELFGAGYSSICKLRGDFDIHVDYELLVWPSANGVRMGLSAGGRHGHMERVSFSSSDFPVKPREVYLTHFDDGVHGITATSDLSGKLRLVRNGSMQTGYYFDSGSGNWIAIHSASVTTADTSFSIGAWSGDNCFANQKVKIAFDNLVVNRGEVICPGTTTPTPSPTPQLKISDLRGTLNTDNDCNLYVADYGDNQVKMINPNGSVTTYASGIDRPRYQVFDSAGNLYVGSFDGNIYKVSASGGKTIVASGIWSPGGMGFDGAGNLYVAGSYDGKIHRIAPDGSKTTMDSGFAHPKHLAVYPDGTMYVVANQGTLIVRITLEGGKANLVDLGETISGMATDGEYLYVSHSDKISRIDTSGQVTQIATDLDQPSSLAVCNGNVFVTVSDGIVKLKISDETKRKSTGSGTSYLEATLSHSGFDFSEGTTGDSLINDGEIIFWQPGGGTHPSYPRDSGYLWWRNANHASLTKDMGAVGIATVREVPAEWDKPPLIPPLLVGHTIVAKCYDGYVKFQVISVDTADESARVKYLYSPDTIFDEGTPTLQPTP